MHRALKLDVYELVYFRRPNDANAGENDPGNVQGQKRVSKNISQTFDEQAVLAHPSGIWTGESRGSSHIQSG